MAHSRIGLWIAAALGLLAGAGADVAAQMFVATGRDTLRGLPGVEIAVDGLAPAAEREGMNVALIREAVERRLRAGGIRIYASQSENPSPAKPYLYVHVNALELPVHNLHVFGVQVHLRQTVRSPVTDSNIVNAMTWDAHNVFAVPSAKVRNVVDEIQVLVDQFVTDWRAVH